MKIALVETMPEHLVASHKQARNWGEYPLNGAEREWMTEDEAEEIVESDADGYARIVRTAEVPFDLESRVETTDAGDDDEAGYLDRYESPKVAVVRWDSGVTTPVDVASLTLESR